MAEQARHHLTIPQYVADYELGRMSAEEMLVDVLTNLIHFAAETNQDWIAAHETALGHFVAEREEEH